MYKKIVAVDFDGTIVENDFPRIGAVKHNVVDKMRKWYEEGHTIIIWTCRCNEHLEEAKQFLYDNDIPYHTVNEKCNTPFPDDPRKVFANVYLDDRALNVDDIDSFNLDTMSFESDELLNDMTTLICKINELAIHSVSPELDEVRQIARKYGLK